MALQHREAICDLDAKKLGVRWLSEHLTDLRTSDVHGDLADDTASSALVGRRK